MSIQTKLEEFDRLYSCEYRWVRDRINQPDALDYLKKLFKEIEKEHEQALQQHGESEYKRCVDLLDKDHSKCPLPSSCIGYQQAQSDLINNPPKS